MGAIKIEDKDLMSFDDFSKLSKTDKLKVPGKTRIIENERLDRNADVKLGREIRKEIIDFATEEIKPLIEINDKMTSKQADEKAFYLALKIFRLHDIRLQSEITLEMVGAILNITRERVRQNESMAMSKIKHPQMSRKLRNYLELGVITESSDY